MEEFDRIMMDMLEDIEQDKRKEIVTKLGDLRNLTKELVVARKEKAKKTTILQDAIEIIDKKIKNKNFKPETYMALQDGLGFEMLNLIEVLVKYESNRMISPSLVEFFDSQSYKLMEGDELDFDLYKTISKIENFINQVKVSTNE